MTNKITKISIYLSQLGGRHPVFVQLETQDGITGTGEAGIAYGVGAASVCEMIKELCMRFLLGREAGEIEAFLNRVYDLAFWSKGGGSVLYSAVSALEQALWDIQGKALNVPVYAMFGGKIRDKVRVYSNGWTLDADSPAEFAQKAQQALKDGHTALKMYPFTKPVGDKRLNLFEIPELRSIDRGFEKLAVERVKAVRDAVGSDIDLMIDLSTLLTPDAVVHFGKQIEDLDIYWFEEPAEPHNISGLRYINQHLSIPLATGERLYTRYGVKETVLSGCVSVIQPDLGNCGGLHEAVKIASFVEAFGIRIAFHNCASPFLTAVSVQMAACIPNFSILECFNYLIPEHYQILDIAPEKNFRNGYILVNEKPGFGVNIDQKWLANYLWGELTQN